MLKAIVAVGQDEQDFSRWTRSENLNLENLVNLYLSNHSVHELDEVEQGACLND
jgi:hypothetical protein